MKKMYTAVRDFFRRKPVKMTMKVFSAFFKFLFTVFLIGVITVSIVGCITVVYVVTRFDAAAESLDLESVMLNETSIVYTQQDGEWKEYIRLEGVNSKPVALDQIPMDMRHAVIAIEDERFLTHSGVDWKRTVSAFANLVLHFSDREYGGSTITQQLIKVVSKEDDHKIERKVQEIFRALYMERNDGYSKDDILETYLNVLPLSGNVVGVGAAANYYFGKEIHELSTAQCAAIAGITQNPAKYNPYTHPENVRARQEVVLYKMHQLGFISKDAYEQALGEELVFKSSINRVQVYDYYTDLVIEDVIADLMDQYGYSYKVAEHIVFYGGLQIYSYEDPSLQSKIEAIYKDENNFPPSIKGDAKDPQAAIFVMDYEGHVVATVGGRGEKNGHRTRNHSTVGERQPGSAIKPLASYTPALYYDLIHYSSLLSDAPIKLSNGKLWPHNYGQTSLIDRGKVLVGSAIKDSRNTTAAQLVQQLTPKRSRDFLVNNFKFSTLVAQDVDYAPLTLGGFTYGVTCREMAAAYQVFGNGGIYNKPRTYATVSRGGEVLLDTNVPGFRVIDEDTAYIMNQLLHKPLESGGGTASTIAGDWTGWDLFAKTGTSGKAGGEDYNTYFAGGTVQYVSTSWFGYEYNKALSGTQKPFARSLWNKAMKAIRDSSTKNQVFAMPSTVEQHRFCTATGLLVGPNNSCPKQDIGYYKPSNVPGVCNIHGSGGGSTTTPTPNPGGDSTTPTEPIETLPPVTEEWQTEQ